MLMNLVATLQTGFIEKTSGSQTQRPIRVNMEKTKIMWQKPLFTHKVSGNTLLVCVVKIFVVIQSSMMHVNLGYTRNVASGFEGKLKADPKCRCKRSMGLFRPGNVDLKSM